jgi:activator of HSP90 ATPase
MFIKCLLGTYSCHWVVLYVLMGLNIQNLVIFYNKLDIRDMVLEYVCTFLLQCPPKVLAGHTQIQWTWQEKASRTRQEGCIWAVEGQGPSQQRRRSWRTTIAPTSSSEGGTLEGVVESTELCNLQNLVTSKPTRMQRVIDREGGITQY